MNAPASSLTFNPFHGISTLLANKASDRPRNTQPVPVPPRNPKGNPPWNVEMESRYFLDTMKKEGVKPLVWNCVRLTKTGRRTAPSPPDEASDVLLQLQELVEGGEGFAVAKTPEYIEGTGVSVPISYAWRLHRGDFSIQSHIDLHGMNVKEARQAFDAFLKEAVSTGKRAVLIIHGRGLSSPVKPVLKNGVQSWLTSRAWRKWILAFASAQSFDGGAGATYVLLRRYPLSGNFRRVPHP